MGLLEKLRTLNEFMQKTSPQPVDFDEICGALGEITACSLYGG